MNKLSTQATLFGHPKGLFYFFFAELWERCSFYGMRALLMLYMTDYLLFSEKLSFGIFAAYGSLVYVTPLIGGVIADRFLGYKKSIILGGSLMAIGHFVLTIEHPIAFYSALAFLIVGNGFFKPNISSLVGSLYRKGDNRMDAGFMIFYMGVNIGGWIAPLLCCWLGVTYGWYFGFGLAGIDMLIGLLVFNRAATRGVFGNNGDVPNPQVYDRKIGPLKIGILIPLAALLLVPIMALIVKFNEFEHYLIWLVSIVILFGFSSNSMNEEAQVPMIFLVVGVFFSQSASFFYHQLDSRK